jgi:hypothetical protein
MNKYFVEYEEALILKELGFNEFCFKYSEHKKKCENKIDGCCPLHNIFCGSPGCEIDKTIESIPLPIYSQAFKFFRDKFSLQHELCSLKKDSWLITIWDISSTTEHGVYNGKRWDCDDLDEPHTYEEAEEVCLKKIIEIVKK